jgi:NADH-quinone oxidoreductase subunit F
MNDAGYDKPLTQHHRPGCQSLSLEEYEQAGGYQGLRAALAMSPLDVQKVVADSTLRGRGGAGYPTGQKWSFVPMGPGAPQPRYVVVNADEMEPGTMKDRLLLEANPHQLLEGALIAAYAVGACAIYIFLRWAYRQADGCLGQAIAQAQAKGYIGENILGSGFSAGVHVHVSAGRYMCGEETGLLNALEGSRPTPRSKPPFPQTVGLWGKPTIVNNVETLCNVGPILRHGACWFRSLALGENGGTKLYGVSGPVKRPGLWELPLGTSIRHILEDCAGGLIDGRTLRGLLPGGGSTGFLTAEHLDLPMDFDTLEKYDSHLGTGTMIVMDDAACPVGTVLSLAEFFARESCGWCTPCREGLPWIAKILRALEAGQGESGDLDVLDDLCNSLATGLAFCALAPGAIAPLQTALKYFRADFEEHIRRRKCPWR